MEKNKRNKKTKEQPKTAKKTVSNIAADNEQTVINKVSKVEDFLDKNERMSSGKVVCDFEPSPEKTFNRGFTDYFVEKRGECFNFLNILLYHQNKKKLPKMLFGNFFFSVKILISLAPIEHFVCFFATAYTCVAYFVLFKRNTA